MNINFIDMRKGWIILALLGGCVLSNTENKLGMQLYTQKQQAPNYVPTNQRMQGLTTPQVLQSQNYRVD